MLVTTVIPLATAFWLQYSWSRTIRHSHTGKGGETEAASTPERKALWICVIFIWTILTLLSRGTVKHKGWSYIRSWIGSPPQTKDLSSQLVNIVPFVQVQVCRIVKPLICYTSHVLVMQCWNQRLPNHNWRETTKIYEPTGVCIVESIMFFRGNKTVYQHLVFIRLLDDTSEQELMRNISTLTIPEVKDSRSRPASPVPAKATPSVTNRSRTARSLSRPSRTCLKLHTENKPTNFVPFGWNEKKTTVGSKQTYNVSAPQREVIVA